MRFYGLLMGACLMANSAFAAAAQGWTLVKQQGVTYIVAMNDKSYRDQDQYRQAIAANCGMKPRCYVLFWPNAKAAPKSLPMSDAQMESQAASWSNNANTGYRRMLWSCKIFKGERDCL